MAVFEYSRSVSEGTSLLNSVSSFVYHLTGALTEWHNLYVTRNVLSQLSDRELDDIGLVRGDIDEMR